MKQPKSETIAPQKYIYIYIYIYYHCATEKETYIYVVSFLQGADKSLARPGRKQANVSVRMAGISAGALSCRKKNDDSSCLDIVEIARVPDMLSSFFPSCSGQGLISTPVCVTTVSNLDCVIVEVSK